MRIFLLLIFSPVFLYSQSSDSLLFNFKPRIEKSISFAGGYHFYPKDTMNRAAHGVELSLVRDRWIMGVHHPWAMAWYAGAEAYFSSNFMIIPKVGVYTQHVVLHLGVELLAPTNFLEGSLRGGIVFGLGSPRLRFLVRGNFPLVNKDYNMMNRGSFTVVYHFLPISKSKKYLSKYPFFK